MKFIITLFIISISININSSVSFILENDLFYKTDGNYTNGAGITYSDKIENAHWFIQKSFQYIPSFSFLENTPKELTDFSITLRQDMYTPDRTDLEETEIVTNKNPYAGTLTVNLKRINASAENRISTKITIGVSGSPSLADRTQRFVHKALDLRRPSGWHHQVRTEPLFNINYKREWENNRLNLSDNYNLNILSRSSTLIRVGNIHTDFTYKYGWMFGKNVPTFISGDTKSWRLFFLVNLMTQWRYHNIYYDGGVFKDSPHTVEKEDWVNGLETGLVCGLGSFKYFGSAFISFKYNLRTKDYKLQANNTHKYGLLSIGNTWE